LVSRVFSTAIWSRDVGHLVGRVTIDHRGEGGFGSDFHWFVFLLLSPGFGYAA